MKTAGSLTIEKLPELVVSLTPGTFFGKRKPLGTGGYHRNEIPAQHRNGTSTSHSIYRSDVGEK
jgi:hypothetical protein